MNKTSSNLTEKSSLKSLGTAFLAVLSVIFILVGTLLIRFETRQQEQLLRDQTLNTLHDLRESLASRVYLNICKISAVNSIVAMNPDLTQEDFARAIKVQFTGEHDLRNIAVARGMIITLMYPIEGNEAAIGLDYTTVPDQIGSVLRAIESKEIVLGGPVSLVQGGEGLIARTPIFMADPHTGEEVFWGLSSSVLYIHNLLEAAGVQPYLEGLHIALRGRDALGAEGDVFMGESSVFDRQPLIQNIELPQGSWQIAAVPANGWATHTVLFTPLLWAYYIGVSMLLTFTVVIIRLTLTRQDAINALSDARERLEKTAYELTENIPVGTYTMVQPPEGGMGNFAFMSRRFLELTGLTKEVAEDDPLKAFGCAHPDDFDEWVALNAEAFAEKKPFYGETRIIVNGEIRWIRAESRPRTLVDGSTVWEGVLTDITEQKRLEEQLILEKEKAEAANVAKSQFLANMSHEIRTPLNGLIGFTDLLKNTPLNAVQQQYVNNAHVSGHTLLGVISDILDFSKIEAGKMDLESRKTNLPELMEDSIDVVRFHAEKKGLELLLYIDRGVPEFVFTDPVRLKQVLSNLLSNAVKFTEKGEVELKVGGELMDDNKVRLHFLIRDTGIGITEVQRERLFSAFSQADTSTTRRYGGTGLGLAISDMIVSRMGGKIDFDSRHGEGTTFHFELTFEYGGPANAAGDLADGSATNSPPNTSATNDIKATFPRHAVLIDGHPSGRSIFKQKLERRGITCVTFENRDDALKNLAHLRSADVIFCNHIPGIHNALEGIRLLRSRIERSDALPPVVIMHASTVDVTFFEQCEELGVRHLLIKPVKRRELSACLREIATKVLTDDDSMSRTTPLSASEAPISDSTTSDITASDISTSGSPMSRSSVSRSTGTGATVANKAATSNSTTSRRTTSDSSSSNNTPVGTTGSLKILIAEDVHMNMLLLKAILKSVCPSAVVYEAINGAKAVELYVEHNPDLIFMDVQMPEMDGLEATKAIRKLEGDREIRTPIVALTAGVLKEEKDKCYEAGMDYFLTKPIEAARIKEVLVEFNIL